MPTRSNLVVIGLPASAAAIPATVSTAEAPGPPGLTISMPILGPLAGTLITANCTCGPSGFA